MRLVVVIIILLVLAPDVGASAPFRAQLALHGPLALAGDASVTTEDGVIDLAPLLAGGERVRLTWSSASGYAVTTEWERAQTGSEPWASGRVVGNDTRNHAGSTLDLEDCVNAHCEALLFTLDAEVSRLTLAGRVRDLLARDEGEHIHWAEFGTPGHKDAFYLKVDPGSFAASADARSPDAMRIEDARASAEGRIGLLLVGLRGVLSDSRGSESFELRREQVVVPGPLGAPLFERYQQTFIVLELDGAKVDLPSGSPAVLRGSTLDILLSGRLAAEEARGSVTRQGRSYVVHREPVEIEGDLVLSLVHSDADPSAVRLLAEGVPTRVVVAGAPREELLGDRGVQAIAILALLTLLASLGATLLYTRLDERRIIENDRRRAMLAVIRATPGVHAGELARRLGSARVVVQHHLRILERQGYVAPVASGRSRHYFPAGASRDDSQTSILITLRDPRTRRLAELLARTPCPLTQGDAIRSTAMPQRTVSSHFARLVEARGLEVLGGHPRRYVPTSLLKDSLEKLRAP